MAFRDAILALLQDVDAPAAERYSRCHKEGHGMWLECSQSPIGSEGAHPGVYRPFACELRICERCAVRLALDLRERYEVVLSEVLAEQGYKLRFGWSLKLVTLTTSHEVGSCVGDHVKDTLDAARDTLRSVFSDSPGWGAVAGLEAGERGAKLHVHALTWSPYVSQKRLSREWERRSGFSVVDVRSAGGKTTWQDAKARGYYTEEEVRGVVREALKYCVKLTSLSPEQLVDLHVTLRGRRRVRSWGSFYGMGVEVERELEVCEVCGARMMLTPEWAVDLLLERGGGSRLKYIRTDKSTSRPPPEGPLRAPRRLADGALCSATPPVTWEQYSQAVGGGR